MDYKKLVLSTSSKFHIYHPILAKNLLKINKKSEFDKPYNQVADVVRKGDSFVYKPSIFCSSIFTEPNVINALRPSHYHLSM